MIKLVYHHPSEIAKRIGYEPEDIKLLLVRMKIFAKRNQLPKKNLYSSKTLDSKL